MPVASEGRGPGQRICDLVVLGGFRVHRRRCIEPIQLVGSGLDTLRFAKKILMNPRNPQDLKEIH